MLGLFILLFTYKCQVKYESSYKLCDCLQLFQYHGLRISASRVNGDWLCQWERTIFNPPPQNPYPLTDHPLATLQPFDVVFTSK